MRTKDWYMGTERTVVYYGRESDELIDMRYMYIPSIQDEDADRLLMFGHLKDINGNNMCTFGLFAGVAKDGFRHLCHTTRKLTETPVY